jgi:hypothetical protein
MGAIGQIGNITILPFMLLKPSSNPAQNDSCGDAAFAGDNVAAQIKSTTDKNPNLITGIPPLYKNTSV